MAGEQEFADPWQLAGLPGGLLQASYLTSRYAAQYRLIVQVLLEEQQHTLTGVAAADLPGLLRDQLVRAGADPAILDDTLKQRMAALEKWGVVIVFQDRTDRDADFVLNWDRYQLTEVAAELHRAVMSLGQDLASAAAATLAPSVLTANLGVLRETAPVDPAAAASAWSVIQTTHQAMARAAASWQARLAGALAGTPDQAKVNTVQETLRRYVDMWGGGVDTHSERITALISELGEVDTVTWRRIAVHHLGANADNAAIDELTASYAETLAVLRSWFDGPDCQARRLRRQMRDTIGPLLRGQRTLAAVGGHVSRRAELLALASRIDAAADDESAWDVWCATTGLFSARHLPGEAPMAAGVPSFWAAEPVPVAARLRRQGPKATAGGPARITDRSASRLAARVHTEHLRDAAARTEAAVLARSGLRLSQWHDLTAPELQMLMILLGVVASARAGADGVRSATSGDARWLLRADPPPPGAPAAVVHTPDGRLVHPDIRLHITPAGQR